MKLSFSTLGCPGWTWNEVFSTAKDLGIQGVEIRGLGSQMYAPSIKEFLPANIEGTKERLKKVGLSIPILTSGAALAQKDTARSAFTEAAAYIDLAAKLGTKYIRVMGTDTPQIIDGDFDEGARLYGLLCEFARPYGVTPLIETNGRLASSENILSFIEKSGSDNSGILWDVHHTVRFGKEAPAATVKLLSEKIKHCHVKDSTDGNEYKMMGMGTLPLKEAFAALKEIDYDGFISLEWVKRWHPDLSEPGIVFAHFVSYMNRIKL